MKNHSDAPIENTSEPFTAPPTKSLDRAWLVTAVKELRKVNEYGKQNENPFSLPLRWETKAEIKKLRDAQAVLGKGLDAESNKLQIGDLENKITRLTTRLSWTAKSKGGQIDFVLSFAIFVLAEQIKDKIGKYDWVTLADVISKHLDKDLTANQVLKIHKRFQALTKNKEKYRQVVLANAQFFITAEQIRHTITEARANNILTPDNRRVESNHSHDGQAKILST